MEPIEDYASRDDPRTRLNFLIAGGAILLAAAAMRTVAIVALGQIDYDEGVYWQTLRSMSAGHRLYEEVFYSQPPFFALWTHLTFDLGGQTLLAARAGIALVSLTGIAGAGLIALKLRGRTAALFAMGLVTLSPSYWVASIALQADGMSAALAVLALGVTTCWLVGPTSRGSPYWACAAGVTVALSIFAKLLCVAILVPIGIVWIWRVLERRRSSTSRWLALAVETAAFAVGAATTASLLLIPFLESWQEMTDQVIWFHRSYPGYSGLRGLSRTLTGEALVWLAAAAIGLWRGARTKDWHVLPLAAWFAATIIVLSNLSPIFGHHLVAFVGPSTALGVVGTATARGAKTDAASARMIRRPFRAQGWTPVILIILMTISLAAEIAHRAADWSRSSNATADKVADLRASIGADQQVITDEPFIAATAGRDVPPELVDTSFVRVRTKYLTLAELEEIALRPEVGAVLLTARSFATTELAGFETWVAKHFYLKRKYGTRARLRTH